ncbi:MAG: hypothetical protein ACRDKE_10390, partial [Solirubrobacterales bacterium]
AWGGHALIHQPLEFFQANQYWPLKDTLAFSDALIGYAPSGVIGSGVEAATVRYNLLFLFAYALAFAGAYFLARELKLRPAAAVVAGAAFAYAPWRLEQDGHLHVISSGGIPLTLFLLVRGYRRGSVKTIVAGWLVAAWQVSLGFTLGLQLGYLLAFLGVLAGIAIWRGGREKLPPRRVLVATAVGGLILLVTAVTLAIPYQRVLSDHPEAERSMERVASGSGPLWSYLSAPENSVAWGGLTESIRQDHLTSIAEQTLFPGLVIIALVIAGLAAPVFSKRLRIGLGAGAVVLILLSLGIRESGLGQYLPYRALFEFAPGWQGVRTPGRLNTLTSLIFALLAAAGTAWLIDRFSKRSAIATGGVLVALICFEFVGDVLPDAPPEPAGARSAIAAPQLHLPITIAANRRYVYWSTNGFPKIVNGRASIDPASFTKLTGEVSGFPDERSVAALKALGVRSVVLHPYLLVGTRWSKSAGKPIDDLGISRRVQDDLIVYDLPLPTGESGALGK